MSAGPITAVRLPAEQAGARWRTDIQGLRAVAVGLVIAAHAELPFSDGGFIGVDVFFVISGFLITGLLLREQERTGRISLAGFYVRRARRILPAATVVLVALLVYGAFRLPVTQLQDTATDAGWASVFLVNWHFAAVGADYFADPDPSLIQHYWSLAVEEQFYLVWPLLALLLLPRMRRAMFAAVAGTVFALSLGWSLYITAAEPAAAYFSTPARAYELAAGALLACLGSGVLRGVMREVAAALGIVLLGIAVLWFDADSAFPGWQALLPTLATVALLAAGPQAFSGRLLSWRPLRYLGDISFSLYLWHWPILQLMPTFFPHSWSPRIPLLIGCALTLVVSVVSYHLIEQPFHHKRVPVISSGRRPLLLWPISIGLVLALGWGATSYSGAHAAQNRQDAAAWFAAHNTDITTDEGVPDVAAELRAGLDLADRDAPIPPTVDPERLEHGGWRDAAKGCYALDGKTSAKECVFGDPDADTVVAVVGDSHAAMWIQALDAIGEEQGFQVHLYAKVSCAHYPVTQQSPTMMPEECEKFRAWTHERLEQLHPDTIITTARGELWMRDRDGRSVDEQWSAAVSDSIDELTAITPDVRVLGDVPTRADPKDCLSMPDAVQRSCVSEPAGQEAESNALTEAAAEGTAADYVDVTPFVCAGDRCPLVVGNYVLYEDDSHLAGDWIEHVAPRLAEVLGPIPR